MTYRLSDKDNMVRRRSADAGFVSKGNGKRHRLAYPHPAADVYMVEAALEANEDVSKLPLEQIVQWVYWVNGYHEDQMLRAGDEVRKHEQNLLAALEQDRIKDGLHNRQVMKLSQDISGMEKTIDGLQRNGRLVIKDLLSNIDKLNKEVASLKMQKTNNIKGFTKSKTFTERAPGKNGSSSHESAGMEDIISAFRACPKLLRSMRRWLQH
jgi:hypothetical protein